MGIFVFFCVHDAAASRGQYLISLDQGLVILFQLNSLPKYVSRAPENAKKSLKTYYFGTLGSFKVIAMLSCWCHRKFSSSAVCACYDKQQVGVDLQPFPR